MLSSIDKLTINQIMKLYYHVEAITPSACTKIIELSEMESEIKEVCDLSKIKTRPDDGRVYII
jgi:hypothetical protein